ncbi:MAG: hypothetical protein QOF56_418 [Acidobacteriaceae bacterium]|jgi:hypothetical protein|nr:hypothetical protein [Acidobacteriaceae bacterium]
MLVCVRTAALRGGHTTDQRESILGAGSAIMLRTVGFSLMFAGSDDDLVRLVMTGTAYLAGPDVFLPNAVAHAATKVEICRRLGLRGLPPLNEDAETAATELEVWQAKRTSR